MNEKCLENDMSPDNSDAFQEDLKEAQNGNRKLIEFCVMRTHKPKNKDEQPIGTKERFCIYGTCTWDEIEGMDDIPFQYPEFDDLCATQVLDGKEIPYTPKGASYSRKFNVDDMITSALATEIWGATTETYLTLYLGKDLRKLIDFYRSDEKYVLSAADRKIYKYILASDLSYQLKLDLVTDKYIYYSNEGIVYALSTSNHHLMSDNEFADIGYWHSVENIRNGTEKLLWGTMPETDEN